MKFEVALTNFNWYHEKREKIYIYHKFLRFDLILFSISQWIINFFVIASYASEKLNAIFISFKNKIRLKMKLLNEVIL